MPRKKTIKTKTKQKIQIKEKEHKCLDCKLSYSETDWQEWFGRFDPPLDYYQCEVCYDDEERSHCQECGDYIEGLKLCSCCPLRILCDDCRGELDDYDWIL